MITIDQLKTGKYAIYPSTKEEWVRFAYNMEREGYKWDNDNVPTVNVHAWSSEDILSVNSENPKKLKLHTVDVETLRYFVENGFTLISSDEIDFPQRHAGNLTIEVANGKAVAKFYVDNRLVRTRTAINGDPETATKEAVRMIFDNNRLEVGDVVRFNEDYWKAKNGDVATIKGVNDQDGEISFEMDEAKTTHDCDGLAKQNSGIYAHEDFVEHINI